MFGHIGITINNKVDIQNFYKDILGMQEIKEFKIPTKISKKIFKLEKNTSIVVLAKDNFVLELFYCQEKVTPVYNHIAIYQNNRMAFVDRVEEKGYPVHIISRENKKDLIFVEDHSGNKIEISEYPD
ncbi:MAG TPA: VOC family protein [bacterium]|nr:VOC family protein [bacterium]